MDIDSVNVPGIKRGFDAINKARQSGYISDAEFHEKLDELGEKFGVKIRKSGDRYEIVDRDRADISPQRESRRLASGAGGSARTEKKPKEKPKTPQTGPSGSARLSPAAAEDLRGLYEEGIQIGTGIREKLEREGVPPRIPLGMETESPAKKTTRPHVPGLMGPTPEGNQRLREHRDSGSGLLGKITEL